MATLVSKKSGSGDESSPRSPFEEQASSNEKVHPPLLGASNCSAPRAAGAALPSPIPSPAAIRHDGGHVPAGGRDSRGAQERVRASHLSAPMTFPSSSRSPSSRPSSSLFRGPDYYSPPIAVPPPAPPAPPQQQQQQAYYSYAPIPGQQHFQYEQHQGFYQIPTTMMASGAPSGGVRDGNSPSFSCYGTYQQQPASYPGPDAWNGCYDSGMASGGVAQVGTAGKRGEKARARKEGDERDRRGFFSFASSSFFRLDAFFSLFLLLLLNPDLPFSSSLASPSFISLRLSEQKDTSTSLLPARSTRGKSSNYSSSSSSSRHSRSSTATHRRRRRCSLPSLCRRRHSDSSFILLRRRSSNSSNTSSNNNDNTTRRCRPPPQRQPQPPRPSPNSTSSSNRRSFSASSSSRTSTRLTARLRVGSSSSLSSRPAARPSAAAPGARGASSPARARAGRTGSSSSSSSCGRRRRRRRRFRRRRRCLSRRRRSNLLHPLPPLPRLTPRPLRGRR